MNSATNNFLDRITFNPAICSGKPTIRNMRFTVAQMLGLLASGMSKEEILADYSFLESDDIQACLLYAAHIANVKAVLPLAA
jgi:uncharacterized protein (DUF433 family)